MTTGGYYFIMNDNALFECNSCKTIFKAKKPDFCKKCGSEDFKLKSINIINIPFFLNVSSVLNKEKLHIKTKGLFKNKFLKSFSQLYSYMDDQKPGYNGKKLVFSLYLPALSSKPFKRVIKNHLLKGFFKLSGGPDAATLAITQACQANCVHCSAHRRLIHKRDELSINDWIKIIKSLVNSGCYNITFTGVNELGMPLF